jgi:hypothetical protein
MSDGIDRYLEELRRELGGSDPAMIQDALFDAEEHLQSALHQARQGAAETGEEALLARVLEEYGQPAEVAAAYREFETRSPLPLAAPPPPPLPRSPFQRFFRVLGDPRAYAALLFGLFSLITGILYFTWAVTGLSLSLGLMPLVIGLPFFGLFLFSMQGFALVEGRLIETMLGIRMPRRPPRSPSGSGLWGKFKARLKDPRTWTTFLYMILKLPLGVLSFSILVVLLAYSLELILLPVMQLAFGIPLFVVDDMRFLVPIWAMPILMLAGFLDLIVLLHLSRWVGRVYGGSAKAMLVRG